MRALSCAAVLISCLAPAWAAKRTPPNRDDYLQVLWRDFSISPSARCRKKPFDCCDRLRFSPNGAATGTSAVQRGSRLWSSFLFNWAMSHRNRHSPRGRPAPAGRTRLIDGRVQPFIEIECERVRASLHAAERMTQNLNTDAALGRALARVLSHELYHVLARTTEHTRTGIAKPSLSGADLVSAYLAFAPADLDRMTSPQEDSSVRISSRLPGLSNNLAQIPS